MWMCIVAYIAGILLFCLYEAAIGFSVDFDGYENPPPWLVSIFWPIAIPILMFISFAKLCGSIKKKRIEKESKREKIRIALKHEETRAVEEAERELEQELRYRRRA